MELLRGSNDRGLEHAYLGSQHVWGAWWIWAHHPAMLGFGLEFESYFEMVSSSWLPETPFFLPPTHWLTSLDGVPWAQSSDGSSLCPLTLGNLVQNCGFKIIFMCWLQIPLPLLSCPSPEHPAPSPNPLLSGLFLILSGSPSSCLGHRSRKAVYFSFSHTPSIQSQQILLALPSKNVILDLITSCLLFETVIISCLKQRRSFWTVLPAPALLLCSLFSIW